MSIQATLAIQLPPHVRPVKSKGTKRDLEAMDSKHRNIYLYIYSTYIIDISFQIETYCNDIT